MNNEVHPREFLPDEQTDLIRKYASDAENLRQLHEEQSKIIFEEQWFKMFVPRAYGGLAYSLPEVLRTEEAIAWADGSTGWVVTLCSGAGWFAGFLDPSAFGAVLRDDRLCIAGSGARSGTAEVTQNGYRVNGTWKYATGSPHATMFTANCVIAKNGIPLFDDAGDPLIMAFIFFADEIQVIENWQSMGMIATASHGFSVRDLHIPADRAFRIDGKHATLKDAVYQYPFLQLAETTLAVNYSGMAQRFLELAEEIVKCQPTSRLHTEDHVRKICECMKSLQDVRASFYKAAEDSWLSCSTGEPIRQNSLQEVSDRSYKLYRTSLSTVQKVYPLAGMAAANVSTEINRVWRNIHTASQHTLFALRDH